MYGNGNGGGGCHSGKECDTPVSRRGEGHATLPSSTATDHGTGISPWPGSWRRSLHRGAVILGRLMPRFSHAQQACQVCQCFQWWYSGKECPPLPSHVRVQGAGHATLPSSTVKDYGTGISPWPGSWRRSLHRCAAILGHLMPRFSHAQQACQVCQCSQWWHSER